MSDNRQNQLHPMELNQNALEAAISAAQDYRSNCNIEIGSMEAAIRAYLTASHPSRDAVTPEAIIAALAKTEFHRSQIQGFFAEKANVHYVRDCTRDNDQQIWSACGFDYDAIHARMMERIELERWRLVLAALSESKP